jgi:membrane associated rhomboid family serine protease
LMFIPIEFTARTYAITVAAGSALLIVLNAKGSAILPGISHFGHLAGMVAGFLFFNKDKIFRIFKR